MLNCVIAVRPICLKIPSNLLHMELNRTQVHEIWVFKPLWWAVHVHVVQISITVIKWLENHLNVLKGQMTPEIFQNLTWQLY